MSRGEVVRLKVYDLLGREVATLLDKPTESGAYEVEFHGGNLPSKIYFYRIQVENFAETKKIILLK